MDKSFTDSALLLLTCGSPSGIGPEVVVKFLAILSGLPITESNKHQQFAKADTAKLSSIVKTCKHFLTDKLSESYNPKLCLIGNLDVLSWHARSLGLVIKVTDSSFFPKDIPRTINSTTPSTVYLDDIAKVKCYQLTSIAKKTSAAKTNYSNLSRLGKIILIDLPIKYSTKRGLSEVNHFADFMKSANYLYNNTKDSLSKKVKTTILKLSGEHAYKCLEWSRLLLKKGKAWGVVNAPVNKQEISTYLQNISSSSKSKPGLNHQSAEKKIFTGQTEFYANIFNTKKYSMVFFSPTLNVVLLTTHVPLSRVPTLINKKNLNRAINHAYEIYLLKQLKTPILFLGLNPHAGEGGTIGKEDEFIKSVINHHQHKKYIRGPLSADTALTHLFGAKKAPTAPVVISCYHDQGLIPVKMLSENFFYSVNISWGLPFVRTSVDHGTAHDIVGKGLAHPGSFLSAVQTAIQIRGKV